jgi:hypothetical protein
MADTPKSIKVTLSDDELKERLVKELKDAYDEGFDEGIVRGRREILDWLQNAYIEDVGRPDRGTPRALAILDIAKAAAKHFRLKLKLTD